MRKTVQEWLDANQHGEGRPKKKRRRKKRPASRPSPTDAIINGLFAAKTRSKKKSAVTKTIRKRKPR